MSPNFVFLNKGDGTFEDATETSGAGYDSTGHVQSSMGADAEDIDGDGLPELTICNFEMYNTLYRNLGDGQFADMTATLGLATDTKPWIGWGLALVGSIGSPSAGPPARSPPASTSRRARPTGSARPAEQAQIRLHGGWSRCGSAS